MRWSAIIKLKKFISFTKDKPVIARQFIKENIPIGEKFTFYVDILKETLGDKISLLTIEDIFSLLIISEDGFLDPLETFKNNSEKIFFSVDKINNAYSGVLKCIKDFSDYIRAMSMGKK